MNKPETILADLIGQYGWSVDWDSQLNLSIHFGDPWLSVWGPLPSKPDKRYARPKGQWWLWVWLSYWKLTLAGGRHVTSTSRQRDMALGLSRLEGQVLIDASVDAETGRTRLAFDLGATLDIRRMSAGTVEELWSLYRPRGYVFSVYGDGTHMHERRKRKGAAATMQPN
jgi:hypothetical protein